jgi:glycosyltransferase involved in cell wall biosynthesis
MTVARSSPTVTIVITSYRSNVEHLREAIDSARSQSFGNLEIIVSDDSPTPALQSVANASGDGRVQYVHHRPSLGVAKNHWWCFAKAHGEFIAILNHDDRLEPTFVETLLPPLIADDSVALSFCDHWLIDARGRRLESETDAVSSHWGRAALSGGVHRPFLELLADQTIPMAMGTIFRKSFLPVRFPDDAGPAYDLWLTYLLARTGDGAYYVPRRLSSWRTHGGNLTSQAGTDWLRGSAQCWASIADDPNCHGIRPVAQAKAATGFAGLAFRAIAEGDRAEAASLARRSMAQRYSRKAGAVWLLSQFPSSLSRRLVAVAPARRSVAAAGQRCSSGGQT